MAVDRNRLNRLVEWALAELEAKRGETYPRPVIKWDLKGARCLGQAVGGRVIRLHPEAAEKLGDAYESTVIHEACHIAAEYERRKYAPLERTGRWSAHGGVWKAMMRALGQQPNRTACLPENVTLTPARTVRRFEVACQCRTHVITSVRLNKGLGRYHCKACKSPLTLVKEVTR